MEYEAVIGLEVHAQMLTKTKLFCSCSASFGDDPNANTCPICLGFPGVLPKLNRQAVEYAIRTGLALGCRINGKSVFSRKNYFYPDLPKGYQISQYDLPLCSGGNLKARVLGDDGRVAYEKEVRITRIHMEEDAGKSLHEASRDIRSSLIDLNRACTPLMEIVSEPDIRSAREASAYLKELRQVLLYLGVCDGNMEEGSLRCDANVSLRPKGSEKLGTRTETKNVNSFRFLERAIEYEIRRQEMILSTGGTIVQETRLFDANTGETRSMRSKEEAHDYRYFPEPDLLPLVVSEAQISDISARLPELPEAKRQRFISDYSLSDYDAGILSSDKVLASFFEKTAKLCGDAKVAANWIQTEVLREVKDVETELPKAKVTPETLAALITLIQKGTISGKIAKDVFGDMWTSGKEPEEIVKSKGLVQVSDEGELAKVIDNVIAANAKQVEQYKGGKQSVFGFFVGAVMKATQGKANPAVVNRLLKEKLG